MAKCRVVLALAISVAVLLPSVASGQSTTCNEAYEKAQEEKVRGHLEAALGQLRICVAEDCAKFIRDDCSRWLDQVESALPSIVFAVRRNGADQTDVEVLCDGKLLTRALDGKAVAVDPGLRTFSFSVTGFRPIEKQLLIREGEHNRIVDVEFRSPAKDETSRTFAPGAARTNEASSGSGKLLAYGLVGMGALGVAGFTLFGLWGRSQQNELEHSCAPYCDATNVDSVRTKYWAANGALAVGLVSLGVAVYLYVTSRHDSSDAYRNEGTMSFLAPQRSSRGGRSEGFLW